LRGWAPVGQRLHHKVPYGHWKTMTFMYPSGEPHLPFQVKPLSSVLMDDLKVAHKYGGGDGA
jgi:hypothetical protein